MERKAKIVIIGAGVSGLSAAAKLIQNNFTNVVVLEASDRIGGRILSVPFGTSGDIIDLGAQWVSGENEVFNIMRTRFELGETGIAPGNTVHVSSDGSSVNQEDCAKLQALGYEIMEMTDEMRKSREGYGQFWEAKYREALLTDDFKGIESELANQIMKHHQVQFDAIFSSNNWNQVPARYVPTSVDCEGSQSMTWKKSGYKTFVDFIISNLQETNQVNLIEKVITNKKVVNIDWQKEKVSVKCEDGSDFSADHVIVTIPHGVLKAHHQSLFTPALPETKVKAIESLGFGTLGKVFLEFNKRIFPDDIRCFTILWASADENDIKGTDREWLLDIYGLMHVDEQEKLVEILVAGEKMKDFEMMDDSKIVDDIKWLMAKCLKTTVETPSNVIKTRWMTNENFLGSYAYPAMTFNDETHKDLCQSLMRADAKPIILFAGEATSEKYQGYVHGALETGLRAAQELINL